MENSLAKVRPDVAAEWSKKNLPLTPEDVSYGSHERVWWKGSCGHEWQATIHSRTAYSKKTRCPFCTGHRVLPGFNDLATKFPEIAAEWSERNEPYVPEKTLAFSNHSFWWKGSCGHEWFARVADRTRGHGCPYCKDHKVLSGFNDLATLHPKLAAEWSYKNHPEKPETTPQNKAGMYWWKCSDCGMEYQAWISSRIKGTGCPYCAGRIVVAGVNDLATTDPEIASEWDVRKNGGKSPTEVHRNSKEYYWWTTQYGYSWQAKISERTIEGIEVRPSGAEYRQMLPVMLLGMYAGRKKLKVLVNSEALTGITLEMIVPELKLAIEMESERKQLTKEQQVKKHICESYGFQYMILKRNKDTKKMAEQIIELLRKKHIYVVTNIDEDLKRVQSRYLELLRLTIQEKPKDD